MTHRYRNALVIVVALTACVSVDAQERDAVTDPEAYALYGLLLPPYWTARLKEPIMLQRETESPQRCANPKAPDSEWQTVVDNFHEQNKRVRLLQPLLPEQTRYRFISQAEIEADDARLAIKYPGSWQRRPESMDYAAVSAVGFNAARSKAVLYIRLRDQGGVYFMEKRDGTWVRSSIPACGWIA